MDISAARTEPWPSKHDMAVLMATLAAIGAA
jgi:hypothetical protein